MDEYLRRLERAALTGDPEAIEHLTMARRRAGHHFFYLIRQNNVMGVWRRIAERGIGDNLIIEAHNQEEAEERLFQIVGSSANDYCGCCGSRWHQGIEEYPDLASIRAYAHLTNNDYPEYWARTYLHLLDGSFSLWTP